MTEGLSVTDAAVALGSDTQTMEVIVRELAAEGLVEMDGANARLVPMLRSPKVLYKRIAVLIRPGEWASYGDLSEVATGSLDGRQAVGREAATDPSFPNPHRLLLHTGEISPSWRDADGFGADSCRELLQAEGVTFNDDGVADPSQRASVEVLRARWNPDSDDVLPATLPKWFKR